MAETALLSIAHSSTNNTTSVIPNNNDLTQTMVKLLSHWQDFQSRATRAQPQQRPVSTSPSSDADRPAASSKGLPPSLKNLLNSNDSSFELRDLLPAATTTTATTIAAGSQVDHKNNTQQAAADDSSKKSSRRRSRTAAAATQRPEATPAAGTTTTWSTTNYPPMNAYLQDPARQLHRPVAIRPGTSHAFASLALAASSCPSSPSARGFSSPIASPPNPSTPEFAPVNPFGGQKQVRWDESETRSRSSSIDCSSPHSHTSPSPSPPAGSKKRELIFCTIFSESDLNGDKPKQKRRRKEQTQLEILEEVFKKDPLPSRKTKERLAQEVGLPHRAVQVWFQNRRAKERRSLRDQGVSESNAAMPNPWAKAE